jgi:hypothetical protein
VFKGFFTDFVGQGRRVKTPYFRTAERQMEGSDRNMVLAGVFPDLKGMFLELDETVLVFQIGFAKFNAIKEPAGEYIFKRLRDGYTV